MKVFSCSAVRGVVLGGNIKEITMGKKESEGNIKGDKGNMNGNEGNIKGNDKKEI